MSAPGLQGRSKLAATLRRVVTDEDGTHRMGSIDNPVRCPCGGESAHIVGVAINAGGSLTIVSSSGTSREIGGPVGRGSRLVTAYEFETCGHLAARLVQFHKGDSFQDWEILGQQESPEDRWPDVWRD